MYWSIHRKYIFLEDIVDTDQQHVKLISMSQAVACDAQAVAGDSKLLKIEHRRALVKYLLY